VDCNDVESTFDESYKGFHFYDHSLCIKNYLLGVNIGVITDIRILHKSVGRTNNEWELNRQQFVNEYQDEFPIMWKVDINVNNTPINLINQPFTSIIIPTKNNFRILYNNIKSWIDLVKYNNYEIIIADTGSDSETLNEYNKIKSLSNRIKFIYYDYYNFGKINNDVSRFHVDEKSELLLFCNDDVELLNDTLSNVILTYNDNKDTVGTIGIRLHFEDNTIQHNGILAFRDEKQLHLSHVDLKLDSNYSMGINKKSIGNTGAFLLINKELFYEIGGFNENYIECFEDVELNFECLIRNKINITNSVAVAYHYESMSRNKNENKIRNLNIDYVNNLFPFYLKNKLALDRYIKKI
jgi:GT2 family glycosyltransferase